MRKGLENIDEYLKFIAAVFVCYFALRTDETIYFLGESL
jgi:hypothetical protein